MSKVRTRYAPSPTGYLHIGGARTALFCFLSAKSMNGEFIIRLEDTDKIRNLSYGEKNQIDGLNWLGIIPDYFPDLSTNELGPLRQSERLEIYDKYIRKLLEKGDAYECWCSPEELEIERQRQLKQGITSPTYNRKCLHNPKPKKGITPSIRVKVPDDEVYEWKDGVRGMIKVPSSSIGDWVIKKSNGIPTYNFANVIDDYLMKITFVHRGEEHLANTPKQLHIYKLFGWKPPIFLHLTIITNQNGKKLSKRDGDVLQFIHLYRERGYLPAAVFNYLSLLGWSPKGEEEIFSKNELIKIFSHERLSKSPSQFDIKKLKWINNQYIQKLQEKELNEFLSPFLVNSYLTEEQKQKIFKVFQSSLYEGKDIVDLVKLFEDDYRLPSKYVLFIKDKIKVINSFILRIENLSNWNKESIKSEIMLVGDELKIKGKDLLMPLRLKITGKEFGPDLSSIIEIFGKDKTLERLKNEI